MEPRRAPSSLTRRLRSTGSGMPESIACCHERRKNEDTANKAPRERALARASGGAEFGGGTRRYGRTYIGVGPSDVAPVTFRMRWAGPQVKMATA